MNIKMGMLSILFFIMGLLAVEGNHNHAQPDRNVISNYPPPISSPDLPLFDDSWTQVRHEQLEHARLEEMQLQRAENGYGVRNVRQKRSPSKALPQRRNQRRKGTFSACYFNPISCF